MRRVFRFVGLLVCLIPVVWAEEKQVALVEAVAPVYPLVAAYSATSGQVKVVLTIDRAGTVSTASIVEGQKLLTAAALEAARKWRFVAGDEERKIQILFSFRILPKGTSDSELAARFHSPFEMEVRHVIPEATTNSDPATDPPKRKTK